MRKLADRTDEVAWVASRAAAVQRPGTGARALENIAKTGDNILEAMQRVTRQYEELGP